ncbi:MAG: hypothetical protein KDB22_14465 [Planctomycetales bacterium]|nr:hypothetical protein [Planctomycetales bacterium]
MTTRSSELLTSIPLERPASVRKFLPAIGENRWLLPEYVVGEENEPLRYLFQESTVKNLHSLSPVVLYGEGRVGKTALAITLAVAWSRLTEKRPLCFTTGRNFSEDFTSAIEIDDSESFRNRHRDCQLLVIDDFMGMASASAAQIELANTLDELASAQRPAILTCNRLPATLASVFPALASRLTGGFSLQLHRPAAFTIKELAWRLCHQLDPKLPVEQVCEICVQLHNQSLSATDVKTVISLAQHSLASTGEFRPAVVRKLAMQHFASATPTIASIAKIVAKKMRIRLVELRGPTREAAIVRARGLAIYLSRTMTESSLHQIGQYFGGRDHSTVIHACRKTEQLLETDSDLATTLQDVRADLHGSS